MAQAQSDYIIKISLEKGQAVAEINGVKVKLSELDAQMKKNAKTTENSAKASQKFNKANQDLISSSGLAGATLVEFGRFVSDLPFGITAVTNNLSQLATLFITLGAKTGGVTSAFGLLIKQLKGPLGFILVFQVVISLLQAFQKEIIGVFTGQEKLTKANEELTKSYRDLAKAISEDNEEISKQDEVLEENIEKLKGFRGMIELLAAGRTRESMDEFTQGIYDRFMLVKEAVEEATGVVLDTSGPGFVKALDDLNSISEKTAKSILDAKNNLEAARIKETMTPVELLEEQLRIYIMEQEAIGASREKYINSPEYVKLEAKIEKAKIDARQKAIDENYNARIKQVDEEIELERALLRRKTLESGLDPVEIAIANLEIYRKQQRLLGIKQKEYINSPEYLDLQTELIKAQMEVQEIAKIKAGLQDFNVLFTPDETVLMKEARKELEKGTKSRANDVQSFLEGEQKKLNTQNKTTKASIKLSDKEREAKTRNLLLISNSLGLAQNAFAEGTAANKALGVANATIDTYAAADAILNPTKGGGLPFPLNIIAAAAVVTAGLANVKQILSVKVPSGKGGGVSTPSAATGGAPQIQAPDFNVVGATAQSQLAETIAGAEARPTRAYVVGKDITTQQELDRNITNIASF